MPIHCPAHPLARLLALLLLLATIAAQAWEVTDDTGHMTTFEHAPQRVVSLLPSATEAVCALDACEQLVGVDRYSDWPPEVRDVPRVGGVVDPVVEAIVALQPDLVLMATTGGEARLRALGLKVLAFNPSGYAGAHSVIRRIAAALRVDGADALLARIDDEVQAVADALPPQVRGRRVYFEFSPGPYAASSESFVGELMARLGLENIVGPGMGAFPKINPELVVRAQPDLILISFDSAAEMHGRPGWARLHALQRGHVCILNASERELLTRAGPRIPEAVQRIADCVLEHLALEGSTQAQQ